ncbi:MAG: sterol desaturase family protein [Gemmatimonadaceae bacterium]|nr:sterol desaturase family protein [Gemmatimonadaceae bacterium]
MEIIQASIPLFFLLIAVELGYAWLGRRSLYRLNDSISDLSAGTLSQIAGIFTKLLLFGVFGFLFEHARVQRVLPVPEWPPHAGGWIVAFILVDLAYYWFHRVSHEVNLFWAGHVVHHSSEEYNLAVALRQSAIGGLFGWVFYAPLALLGMPWEQFAVCYALNLVYQFWIHTRVIHRLPAWCEAVFNTPSHHRVHHGVNPEYQDRNYAGVFIIWDKLWGTFTPERDEPVYGLTTPLASWNPLWAQVHQYVAIARNVWRATDWTERWHYVFASPAWRPARDGGPIHIPDVTRAAFQAFDPAVPPGLSLYALTQFVLAVPGALWLLTSASRLPVGQLLAGTFVVALTLTNIGGLLEGRRWALSAEGARTLALAISGAVWLASNPGPRWMGIGILMAGLCSFGGLLTQRHALTASSDERMDPHFHAP